ncbi:MAG: glycosyl transferase family 1 [Thermotogae bacterium]|nr:glycosyltransferase [Thermotogota bacterium]RKX42860.1 MAG: glycosyl transferase family 1 [Thermotogota bacterium]
MMAKRLEDYREIVGDEVISRIHRKMRRLYGKSVQHVNSTFQGGGVAEMLWSLIPLKNDIGLRADWRIIHGTPAFFEVTKSFHNGLQGEEIELNEEKKGLYLGTNEEFARFAHIERRNFVVVHDPQPLAMISQYRKEQPWIWRCHIDLSHPNPDLWSFLKPFILRYDVVIVSHESYKKEDLPVEYRIIHPAIDPLTPKNAPLPRAQAESILERYGVRLDKPLIVQISRFDKWKDPLGVVEVYKRVRQEMDSRLVLCGSMAPDDPEGSMIYKEVLKSVEELIKGGDVVTITAQDDLLVNALQSLASVVIQKSTREGFGLTVTEALWKGTPVVASNVGGIPLQIEDGVNGFLLDPKDYDGFADAVLKLLKDEALARRMGETGREKVREKFLITRLLEDYITLMEELI